MGLLSPGDIAWMNTTTSELANATLTVIEAPGPLARNNDPGTPVTVWEGEARGFLERTDRDVLSGGVQVREQTDTFILYDAQGAPVESLRSGSDSEASTVVIRDERLATVVLWRFTVVGMQHEADGTLDHVLLTLNAGAPVA
jgi:hypothetical protein